MKSKPIHDKVCALCNCRLPLYEFEYDLSKESAFCMYCKLCDKRIAREKRKAQKKHSK